MPEFWLSVMQAIHRALELGINHLDTSGRVPGIGNEEYAGICDMCLVIEADRSAPQMLMLMILAAVHADAYGPHTNERLVGR